MAAPELPPLVKDFGYDEEMNPRYRRTMEDAHVFFERAGLDRKGVFFGVFDGHGGTSAVEFVRDNIYRTFMEVIVANPSAPIATVMAETFKMTDKKMEGAHIEFDGCTAAVVFIRREILEGKEVTKIYSANCGDARTVLVRNGTGKRLSFDHKPNLPEEVERIQAAGGFVAMGRVNGVLAVSRALGDIAMKKYVTSDPYVSETIVDYEKDTHIIVACDGVWDVVNDDEAAKIITEKKGAGCEKAAEALKQRALDAGSMDNVSVMVVQI
ncbi:putative protein phosphatase 2C-related protein [Monocercomonoides exilis]|uniref:putative protein phosphatase 2C-related protein n=1 Tax=Monocercomonoides exilis TaxID=2049356 RepID=UPI00355A71AF|nr:putative protein phosphatase 2C-related protein [Monocercomonoides exilis]|eukprot:MONOS_1164.1-p1 / transcript=MONOS_1164.1 / gene=MONOS_1164 / organism=Monocercomonoides_exilis_PA203 / gene_product=protein phosphatase 2C-related protein / transcript_product=protein phosphatase 2C-related protein / location=Mono_scaffold00019:244025-245197(+) / protein_length=267 / sequence_SO=supercontig / SO=protein_coding / is_pseudo=false